MSTADDRITRPIAVPSYLVYGAIALIVVLSGGPVGQLVMVSHHVYELQDRLATVERDAAAEKVKQDDITANLKSMANDMRELSRTVAILNSKMP